MTLRKEKNRKEKKRKGCWKLKEEVVDRTVWKTGCARSCGPFVRQAKE